MSATIPDIRQALETHLADFVPPDAETPDLPALRSYDGQPFAVPVNPPVRWVRVSLRPGTTGLISYGNGVGQAETTGVFLLDLHEPSGDGLGQASLERLATALRYWFRPGRTLIRGGARVQLTGIRWIMRDEPQWVVASMSIDWTVYARNAA